MISFTGDIRAYCPYAKRIGFLFFCGFFCKPMAAGVSLGFMGYEGLWVMRVMGYEGHGL